MMSKLNLPIGGAPFRGDSVKDYLDREARPVPEYLRHNCNVHLGSQDLPVGR